MSDEVEKMTFPMSRESDAASRLKAIISDMLPISDDVLSEYVMVLVCNGKSQSQVREDLEAFLGEKSEGFVACLWKLLLKNFSLGSSWRRHNDDNHTKATYWMNENHISASLPIDDVKVNVSPKVKSMKMLREELINSPPRKRRRSEVISAIKQPGGTNPDKYEKESVDDRSGFLQKRPYFPARDIRHRHSQYVPSRGSMSAISRVSVWDRLGRPKSDLVIDEECPIMADFSPEPHENEVLHQHGSAFPAAYKHSQKFQREVPEVSCRKY